MGNSRSKQFISFQVGTVLIGMMKSHAVLLHLAQEVSHPLSPAPPTVRHLVAVSVTRWTVLASQCLCSSDPYFTQYCPHGATAVMLEIRICQRKAIRCFF